METLSSRAREVFDSARWVDELGNVSSTPLPETIIVIPGPPPGQYEYPEVS